MEITIDFEPEDFKEAIRILNQEFGISAHVFYDIDGPPITKANLIGDREDLLRYLRSDYYGMDEETIREYYLELLGEDTEK